MVFEQSVVIPYAYKTNSIIIHSKLGFDNLKRGTNLVMTTHEFNTEFISKTAQNMHFMRIIGWFY
jgi:hypothetical protein